MCHVNANVSLCHSQHKRSVHDRQRENYETGEWSTGQKWADDAPKEDVDPDTVSLISSGACGAFVHGLEDEFLGVYRYHVYYYYYYCCCYCSVVVVVIVVA